ncbi:MAG: DUF72 domain-containing protein [Bacteroidota bacterium]
MKALPRDFDLSIEIRDLVWFKNEDKFNQLVIHLNRLNKGLVICDTPGIREACHMRLSNSTAFIRFVCTGSSHLDIFRIEQWRKQIKSWFNQGLEKCFFFLHIYDDKAEIEFSQFVKHELVF